GSMTALSVARALRDRGKGGKVHILERGTWWTTPLTTVQDLEVRTASLLQSKGHRVQFWPSLDTAAGLVDLLGRCFKRKANPDGLYDITEFGRKSWLSILGLKKSDGIRIVHASGVGGGSLIYSNVTIRPPDRLFDTAPWRGVWTK